MRSGSSPQRPQHRRRQRRRCSRRYPHDGTAQLHDNCTSRRRRPFRLNHKLRKTSRVTKHLPAPAINLPRPQVGSPCNLGNVRAGLRYRRYQRLLLLFRPSPSALHARHYRHLTHRTVSCTGANTSACTGAISDYPINPARRPLTEAYNRRDYATSSKGGERESKCLGTGLPMQLQRLVRSVCQRSTNLCKRPLHFHP